MTSCLELWESYLSYHQDSALKVWRSLHENSVYAILSTTLREPVSVFDYPFLVFYRYYRSCDICLHFHLMMAYSPREVWNLCSVFLWTRPLFQLLSLMPLIHSTGIEKFRNGIIMSCHTWKESGLVYMSSFYFVVRYHSFSNNFLSIYFNLESLRFKCKWGWY